MSREFKNYHVPENLAGSQMTAALRLLVGELSWNVARKMIERRQVQVNGNLCIDQTRKLKAGDVVKVWTHPLSRPADERDVKLIYVDEHLVVVHKPAGVTTLRHAEEKSWPADRKQLQPTLDELVMIVLAKHLGWTVPDKTQKKRFTSRNDQAERRDYLKREARRSGRPIDNGPILPSIRAVHRLDRDTSGLLVFARTEAAEIALIRLFRKHTIERSYVAVVHGLPKTQTITSNLVRDRGDGIRGTSNANPLPKDAQRAVTHVKPLKRIGNLSLIECRLETGRTHQIRIHLSEQGFILCGEGTYTHGIGKPPKRDTSGAPRQALHAAELGFVHPITGETLHFRAPLPDDLKRWLLTKVQKPTTDDATAENPSSPEIGEENSADELPLEHEREEEPEGDDDSE